jgi:hypothetical protein
MFNALYKMKIQPIRSGVNHVQEILASPFSSDGIHLVDTLHNPRKRFFYERTKPFTLSAGYKSHIFRL